MPPVAEPGRTTFSTPSDLEITATHVFDAPRALVWRAYTEAKHLQQWCLGPDGWSMPVCEYDARAGGAWRFTWRKDTGTEMTMTGTVLEIRPPELLVNTERWGPEWPETINTLRLTEVGGKTTVTTTVKYPSKAARDAAMQTGMTGGWAATFARLTAYLPTLA